MKIRILIATICLMTTVSYAQDSAVQLPGGVSYKMLHDEPTTINPAIGDYVETHMYVHVDGQKIYSSREVGEAKPLGFVIEKTPTKTDIQEVVKLMTEGDSAVIYMSIDSMLKIGTPKLDWMKPNTGQKAAYTVKMLSIKQMGRKE